MRVCLIQIKKTIRSVSDQEVRYAVGARFRLPMCSIRCVVGSFLSWKGGQGESHEGCLLTLTKPNWVGICLDTRLSSPKTCAWRYQAFVSTPVSAHTAQVGTYIF